MMLKYFTIDVFTDKIFGGNPLAIFLLEEDLSHKKMQSIATEMNYSETSFVLPPDSPNNSAKVRIFTPRSELSFAGHPNVGTGFLLSLKSNLVPGKNFKDNLIFEQKAGLVNVTPYFSESGKIIGSSIEAPKSFRVLNNLPTNIISECLGINGKNIRVDRFQPLVCGVGLNFAIAEVKSRNDLKNCKYNILGFEKADNDFKYDDDFFSLMIFFEDEIGHLHTRVFTPLSGIIEDAATGSACGALGCLMAHISKQKNGEFQYLIHQGVDMGRPSKINILIEKNSNIVGKPFIKGECIIVSEGYFYL